MLRVEPVLDTDDSHVGVDQEGLEGGEEGRNAVEYDRRPVCPPQ
jgi:hypothetical protein